MTQSATQQSAASQMIGIGGYFELEGLAPAKTDTAFRFQSARAALSTLLTSNGFRYAAIPRFLCDTVRDELEGVGISVREYDLERDMSASRALEPEANEAVVLVNYFGLCRTQVDAALARLPRQQCVVDNSQAFFERPSDCLGTVYSPRKFFGLPDGGLLHTDSTVQLPERVDTDSASRCQHLLHRVDGAPEEGLSAYRRAEASLSGVPACRMSTLTARLLASIDAESARAQRVRNFEAVQELVRPLNQFRLPEKIRAPLTYPLQHAENEALALRSALIEARIFTPTYWGECLSSGTSADKEQAACLAASIVHIPIDHRYVAETTTARLRDVPVLEKLLETVA